ncbi:unnamed protein product [Penicillium pancosmium]
MEPETPDATNYRLKETRARRKWVHKVICDCKRDEHEHLNQWPKKDAEIRIPGCALRCPYCGYRNKKLKNQGAEVRRHINRVHINTHEYAGLEVERWYWGYDIFDPSQRLHPVPAGEDEDDEDEVENSVKHENPNSETEEPPAKRARRDEGSSMKLEKLNIDYRGMCEDQELEHSRACEDNSRGYRRRCEDRDLAYAYDRAELERKIQVELATAGEV